MIGFLHGNSHDTHFASTCSSLQALLPHTTLGASKEVMPVMFCASLSSEHTYLVVDMSNIAFVAGTHLLCRFKGDDFMGLLDA